MCFNATASWVSFGVGTGFNFLSGFLINHPVYWSVVLLFQYVLIMQVAEGIVYRAKKTDNCKLESYGTQLAFSANITQPLLVLALLLYTSPVNIWFKLIAIAVGGLYFAYLGYNLEKGFDVYSTLNKKDYNKTEDCCVNIAEMSNGTYVELQMSKCMNAFIRYMRPSHEDDDGFGHFHYKWWDDANWGAVPYLFALGIIIALLLRPICYMLYQVIIIYVLLAVSVIWFNTSVGSKWCFFAGLLPVVNGAAWWACDKLLGKN